MRLRWASIFAGMLVVCLLEPAVGRPHGHRGRALLTGLVIGVVGIDTFQSFEFKYTPDDARSRVEEFRRDYSGSMKAMVKSLFHPEADATLLADAEKRID